MKYIYLLLALTACGQKKVQPMSDPEVITDQQKAKYAEVNSRFPGFLDQGFVVSRDGDQAINQGDSLLFSGLALYALDCDKGEPIAQAFEKMFTDLDGGAYRHPDQADKEVSLDGLLGMYRGINKRVKYCSEAIRWKTVMAKTRAKMSASLPPYFNLVAARIEYILGLGGEPDRKGVDDLAIEVIGWTELVKDRKAACYRVHVGLLALQTMEEMGNGPSTHMREQFAAVTDGLQMPTIDHYSGRTGLSDYLTNFQYNDWQFAMQRCPIWEAKDGMGFQHPGVDFLVGFTDLSGDL